MSAADLAMARRWYGEGISPGEIASRLGRHKTTLTRLLIKQEPRRAQGRPPCLTKAQQDFLARRMDVLIRRADARRRVTVQEVLRSCRFKLSVRSALRSLHKRRIYFRRLREKPVLTEDDRKERLAFAKRYHKKTAAWWNRAIHAHIDGKNFPVYLNGKARSHAAQHATHGAFRSPGTGLAQGYVKPSRRVKFNTGARNVLIIAGVGNGRVLMWHHVQGGRWSGEAYI